MTTAIVIVPLSIRGAAEGFYTAAGRAGSQNMTVLLGPDSGAPTHVAMCPRETVEFRGSMLGAKKRGGPPPQGVENSPQARGLINSMIVYFDPPEEGVDQPSFESDREFFLWAIGQQGLVITGLDD